MHREPRQPRLSHHADELAKFTGQILAANQAVAYRGSWSKGGPAVFEVGCFDGLLLSECARRHPSVTFVGCDWKAQALIDAATKLNHHSTRNAKLIHGPGQDISCWFADGELDEVWLFHPDPCDRPVEWKNRLFRDDWLHDVARVLKPGGRLCLKTDHVGYFQWALAAIGGPGLDRESVRRLAKNQWQDESTLPQPCASSRHFGMASFSVDYWHDAVVAEQLRSRWFWGIASAFEGRFARKNWPIYWMELQRL